MPHINRIRLVNVNFNDAKGMYDDFLMTLNGKSTTYDLMNTGGKSLLLLMLLQTVLPNTYLKKEKPLKNIFIGGNTKRTSHCLVEWILDDGYQYKYMLTGFCARKKQDTELDELKTEDKLEIDYYNYCYFYNDINKYDIEYLPLVLKENDEKEYMSYDKLRQIISNMKKEELPVRIYDSKKEYLKDIEYYGLIPAEWKLISEINVSENYIEKYFKENKTSRKLIENFLIKIIDNVNNEEENKLADTLIDLKDNLMEFRKKRANKQEFIDTRDMYNELKDKNNLLIEEFTKIEKVNKKAYEAYVFNTEKYESLKSKVENENQTIENLNKEILALEKQNKKLEIDELYLEKDKVDFEIGKLNEEKNTVETNLNLETKNLNLAKAQNEYVDYAKNKEEAQKLKIQMDNINLSEKDLKEKYETYGYNYKLCLEDQIEKVLQIYEEQKLSKEEKKTAKEVAKKQKENAMEFLVKCKTKAENLEEKEKELQENITSITQEFIQNGKMELIINTEEGLEKQNKELDKIYNSIELNNKKVQELEQEQTNNQINLTKLTFDLNIAKEKLNLKMQEIEKYEQQKSSLEKLAITFNVDKSYEKLFQKLQEEIQLEEIEKINTKIELKAKEKKLDLIQKYNMVVPNEDIFNLKEKLKDKSNYITTGIEYLKTLNLDQKETFLNQNPIFIYSVFIDDETFKKIQTKNIDIEMENLVPIISYETLRQGKNIEEKDIVFPIKKSIYKNLEENELNKYKQNLEKSISSLQEKIDFYNKKEEKIRNYLTELINFKKEYPKEKIESLYKKDIEENISEIESKIKELNRIFENNKEEINTLKQNLSILPNKAELIKQEIIAIKELQKFQKDMEEIKKQIDLAKADCIAQEDIFNEKEEIYYKIESDLEILTQKMLETEKAEEALQKELKIIPEFNATKKIEESFEEIKNTYKALNNKINDSNTQFSQLQETYKIRKAMMEKCIQNIMQNGCELEYFIQKGYVQSIPNTLIDEYISKVNEQKNKLQNINDNLNNKEKDRSSKLAKIEVLKEQLLNDKQEIYNEVERLKDINEIKKQIDNNKSKINLNQKQLVELKKKIKDVEEKIKYLDKECDLLHSFIEQSEIEEFEVNTQELLESEIYTYKKLLLEQKAVEKEVKTKQNKFIEYIDFIKNSVQDFYIKQDVLDVLEQIKLPEKLSQSKSIQNGITIIIGNLEEKIRHINEALKILEGYQQNFITKCYEKAETVVRDLNKLPGLSRIKIGGKDVNIIKLDLFEYEKEEKQNKIKEYIYRLVEQMEQNQEKMSKEYINESLSSKALVAQIVNMDKAVVKLYKIEDIQENSTYKKWEDDLGSDGQVNAIYFMFAVCIISYISMLTRKEASSKTKKVIIADNPFGATSAVFLWNVMFSILKENNVQLIAPGHNISKEIISMFEVNYILKHEYFGGNKKSVVVDKEIRTEDDLDAMNFEIIQGDQQKLF